MSFRFDDAHHDEYSFVDDVNRILGPVTFPQQQPDDQGVRFGTGLLSYQSAGTDESDGGGGVERGLEGGRSDSTTGQIVDGFMDKPKNGPNPYEGMTPAEKLGRQAGEWIPGWDTGRELFERDREILRKRWSGEDLTNEELKAGQAATDKFFLNVIPFPAMKGAGTAIKKTGKLFFR